MSRPETPRNKGAGRGPSGRAGRRPGGTPPPSVGRTGLARLFPCLTTLATALLLLSGAVFLAVGLGATGTAHPAPRPTPRPASTIEREAHDLHQQLELIRLCRSAPAGEWPCVEATP